MSNQCFSAITLYLEPPKSANGEFLIKIANFGELPVSMMMVIVLSMMLLMMEMAIDDDQGVDDRENHSIGSDEDLTSQRSTC